MMQWCHTQTNANRADHADPEFSEDSIIRVDALPWCILHLLGIVGNGTHTMRSLEAGEACKGDAM